MRKIILASRSPRRQALLAQLGLDFEVEPGEYREEPDLKLAPMALVSYYARQKARLAAPRHPADIILAADTIGVIEGQVIGKPASMADARRILRMLSGKTHTVVTAFTLLDTAIGREITRTVKTAVTFRRLTNREITSYVATGEGRDKAGAYAIQGRGVLLVKEIKGDYTNVVGLPLGALARSLKVFGVVVL